MYKMSSHLCKSILKSFCFALFQNDYLSNPGLIQFQEHTTWYNIAGYKIDITHFLFQEKILKFIELCWETIGNSSAFKTL